MVFRILEVTTDLDENHAQGRWYLSITVDGMWIGGGGSLPFCV